MKQAEFTDQIIVKCPHCNEEVQVGISDLGDNDFPCCWAHCGEWFALPKYSAYKKYLKQEQTNDT